LIEQRQLLIVCVAAPRAAGVHETQTGHWVFAISIPGKPLR
jgi:hypothetical protein